MLAKPFIAIFAGKARIGRLRKALGIETKGHLPANKKEQRDGEQAPCDKVRHYKKRREHHCIIPVIDPTAGAAFVLQKPRLERAEKEDADHIANGIRQCDEQHDAFIKNM